MKEPTVSQACQDYLEDPETNAGHLETCAECRAVEAALALKMDLKPAPISLDALPLAPWEGSSHRAWPFVLGVSAVVVIIALALGAAAGLSPIYIAERSLTSMDSARGLLRNASESLRSASLGARVVFGVAFLIVNALLVVLLRRTPRGIDA